MSVNAVNSDGSLSKIAGGINTNDTDIIKSDLSYVEPYTTATAAHAQGDCFVMNTGQLVRATSAIDIGDTITLNTNVSAVSIIELLAEKVDKVTGKGLSTNDYTDEDKGKVDTITDKTDKTAISSVETTNTAVSAHAVGSYFINVSGQFVKATSAIAIGDTIIVKPTVGYNCEVTTIAEVLEAANVVDSVTDGNMHPVTSNAVFDHFSNYIKIKENLRGNTDAGGRMNISTSDLPLTSYPLLGYNTDGWCAIFYKYSNQWRARIFSVGANGVEILANQTNARLDIIYVNL